MAPDYGVIIVAFHENCTDDQRDVIVNRSIENQVCTSVREHMIMIRDVCKRFASMFHKVTKCSGSVSFDIGDYKFRLVINICE
jgi:hypothetical protein